MTREPHQKLVKSDNFSRQSSEKFNYARVLNHEMKLLYFHQHHQIHQHKKSLRKRVSEIFLLGEDIKIQSDCP